MDKHHLQVKANILIMIMDKYHVMGEVRMSDYPLP